MLTTRLAKLAGISLILAYGTYAFLLFSPVGQSIKWYIFGFHMLLIVTTLLIGIFGAFRADRFCIIAVVAIAPLAYAQFLS
jgi:hypothetical protein